jgi:1-acyl-sn-glycerol-3-phosphate acyltransferase
LDKGGSWTTGLQEFAYRAARFLLVPFFIRRFNTVVDKQPALLPPYVVAANHVTELDFFFLGKLFSIPMGFVVGQGLLQNRLLAFLIVKVFGCIGKQKGIADARTTMGILRRLRSGRNVCLFVEGNTTFDGRTGLIPPATGSLLRAVSAGLVTCRIEGGYFAMPRWGKGIRKGRTACKVINIYTKEMLSRMSVLQINQLLAQDLYEDAYARQELVPVPFIGKKKAEGIEHVLYLCPSCSSQASILGTGDQAVCQACGKTACFTTYGKLEGDFVFSTILEWMAWQKEELAKRFQENPAQPILTDDIQVLFQKQNDSTLTKYASGGMLMDGKALQIGQFSTPVAKITGFEIFRKNILQFALEDGRQYQTGRKQGFNALKYRDLYSIIKEKSV